MITGHFHYFNVFIELDGEVEAVVAEAMAVVTCGVHTDL